MVATLEKNLTATPLGQVLRLPCKFIQCPTIDTPQLLIDSIAKQLASSGKNVLPVMVEPVKKDKYAAVFNTEILLAAKQAGLDFVYCIAIDKEMALQLKAETSKVVKVELNTATELDLISVFKNIQTNIATLNKIDPVKVATAILQYRAKNRIQDLNFLTKLKCGIGKAKLSLLADRFQF
jgi:DNA uptake protein ComE-like DNA-binding protein